MKTFVQYVLMNYRLTAVTRRKDVRFTFGIVLATVDPILVHFEKRDEKDLWPRTAL